MQPLKVAAIAALVTISLAGCAGMAVQQAKEQFAKDRAICRATIPKQIGTYERRAQCIADAMERDLVPAFPNDGARLGELEAEIVLTASKVDRGQLTPEEANSENAQYQAGIAAESEQAADERREAAAANIASTAQMLSASAALANASRPTYVQPPMYQPPVNTTCMQNGAFTNCTSQ